MKIFRLFKRKDNSTYDEACRRLSDVKEKLEDVKTVKFKEMIITEFYF